MRVCIYLKATCLCVYACTCVYVFVGLYANAYMPSFIYNTLISTLGPTLSHEHKPNLYLYMTVVRVHVSTGYLQSNINVCIRTPRLAIPLSPEHKSNLHLYTTASVCLCIHQSDINICIRPLRWPFYKHV